MIFDTNEKIWGGNLSLSPISGILALNDDCGDLARGSNSPSLRQREEKRHDGSALPNFHWPVILEFDSSQKYLLPGDVQCLKNAFTILNDNKKHHSNRNEKLTLYLA